MTGNLPMHDRRIEDLPGHWLLARLGKRVLRPGGRELTEKLISAAWTAGADVVELAPGLGKTAKLLMATKPKSYRGVDEDPEAVAMTRAAVGPAVVLAGHAAGASVSRSLGPAVGATVVLAGHAAGAPVSRSFGAAVGPAVGASVVHAGHAVGAAVGRSLQLVGALAGLSRLGHRSLLG